jgi:hypothetical protein
MKKTSGFVLLLTGIVFLAGSCSDFIEKDISEDTPSVILPQTNDTVPVNPVHFKWDELEGATKYRLQVVSPGFANIDVYALDSIVTGTNFFFALDSAEYQFRLTALNAGYESQTTAPVTFWVGTSAGSSTGGVVLTSPANGAYFNATFDGSFSWAALSGTNTYTMEIHEGSTFAGAAIDYADQLGSVQYYSADAATLPEGQYCWGVKAFLSSGTETAYTKRTFFIDLTNPGVGEMISPSSTQTVTGTIAFVWTLPPDEGLAEARSPVTAVVEISQNAAFTGTVHLYSFTTPGATTGSVNPQLASGTYYWRVRLKDEAGNSGTAPTTPILFQIL